MYFALFYDTVDNFIERRQPYRQEHLTLEQAHRDGRLLFAGALIIFRGESSADAEAFARKDPYVTHGLVKNWRVREWAVVIGG